MSDLTNTIRGALANTEHGDRPDGGICHADCCGKTCECGLNERPRDALRAVLDLCDSTYWTLNANDVRAAIAKALGVSDTQLISDTVPDGNPSPGGER